MPPKQGTLGKFFGLQDGIQSKKQQSTLAFNQKSTRKSNSKEEPVNDENEDMTANESAAVKAESASNGISEECQSPEIKELEEELASTKKKRGPAAIKAEDDEEDDEPVRKRSRKAKPENISQPMSTTNPRSPSREKSSPNKSASTRSSPAEISAATKPLKAKVQPSEEDVDEESAETEPDLSDDNEPEKPSTSKTTREKIQATLKANNTDLYPDWNPGEPVPYAALCATFLPVELTTKRLAIMAHCALFLRQVLRLTPEDLLPAIQLMINKLAADYAGIELGIGESLIMKAIGEATGRSLAVIKSDHNEIGDLGLVAAKSRSNQPTMFKPKPLTVRGVLDSLMHIAVISGNGAQQRKVDGIKKLLAAADIQHAGKGSKGIDITKDKGGPSEAKYIVRFLEGKLRLGLAERTVLVSLAHAVITHEVETKTGKMPSQEKLAEAEAILKTVYSELPNYEVIVPAMLQHGILNLKQNCKLQPGIPLKPMLAKPTKSITEVLDRFEGKSFTCEYKYDGERAQIHYVAKDSPEQYGVGNPTLKKVDNGLSAIFSRNSEDLSKKYPDILARLDSWIKPETKSFVLDCETVAWDMIEKKVLPFQQLMTRKRKDVRVEDVKVKVCVFAFDLLFYNGEAVVRKSLRERRDLLHTAFTEAEGEFKFAQYGDTSDLDEIQVLLDESVKASCEGLMVKMLDTSESGYEPSKRSRNWLKVKKDYLAGIGDSLDLVVLGAYYGKGKRTSWFGAFLLACYNASNDTYETVCNIGTGFSEVVLGDLHTELSKIIIEKPKPFYIHSKGPKDQPDVWFEPRRVWEVKTADLTLSPRYKAGADSLMDPSGKGVSLRFPRFIKERDDKKPDQATAARMVVEMYRKQESVAKQKGPAVDDDFEY